MALCAGVRDLADILDILNVSAVAASSLILMFVVFWALTVRRALVVRVYRSEALGTALISIFLAFTNIVNTVVAYLYGGGPFWAIGEGAFGFFFIFLLVLFFWVDSSVRAVRRSDPLARDTFHWSRLRVVLWVFSLPGQILVVVVSVVGAIALGPAAEATSSPPSTGWIGALLTVLLFGAIFIPIISAVVMLPIIARRTADKTFRAQLIWFGAFAIAYLLIVNILGEVSGFPSGWYDLFFGYIGLVVCAYCLYRSVSSLTPTYRPPLVMGPEAGPALGVGQESG